MGQAIGGSLPLAIGIAISPIPIIAVVLMLTTPRAKINGPAFLLGWLLGLGIVGTIVLTIAGPSCTYPAPFLKKVTNRTSSLPGGTNGLCRPAPRWVFRSAARVFRRGCGRSRASRSTGSLMGVATPCTAESAALSSRSSGRVESHLSRRRARCPSPRLPMTRAAAWWPFACGEACFRGASQCCAPHFNTYRPGRRPRRRARRSLPSG